MTAPLPHWPGRLVSLAGGERVWVAATPPAAPEAGRELVLCVHGMSGAATNWTDLLADLAPDFDGAALDLPGSGFSPPPRAGAGYSVSRLADTVIALTEALGRGPVHLVGNSMGGAVSVRVAARRPDLVRTLTLVSPALPDRRPRREVLQFPVIGLPFVGMRIIRQYAGRVTAEDRVAGVYATCFADPSRLHPDRFAADVEELRRRDGLGHDAAALARAARTLVAETLRPAPWSLWRAAARVTAPSLVLYGASDTLVRPQMAARAARAFRDSRVEVLPDTGHLAQMEHPALVASLFRELAARARGTGAGPGNSGRRDPVDA
jgi:pimeloyl-ACP methyl ester carboxylesterase